MIDFLGFQIFDGPEGDMLADFGLAENVVISDGEHGFENLSAFVPMTVEEALRWYARPGVPWAVLSAGGGVAWEGRVEDVAVVDGGLEIGAFGAWRSLSDIPYTAIWSKSGTADWRDDELANYHKFESDNNNRIAIGTQLNTTYANGERGGMSYLSPHNSERQLRGVSFSYDFNMSSDWQLVIDGFDEGYVGISNAFTLTGNGASQTGSQSVNLFAPPRSCACTGCQNNGRQLDRNGRKYG